MTNPLYQLVGVLALQKELRRQSRNDSLTGYNIMIRFAFKGQVLREEEIKKEIKILTKNVMIMKKKLFFAVVAIGLLASCADNEFVGEVSPNQNPGNGNESAIVFSSGTKALTRADHTGVDAAGMLNSNFVFGGTKTTSHTTVFNNYQANFVANTANTTQSNSNDWEYVSYYNVPGGVKTTAGVVAFAPTDDNSNKVTQSIKYWDYATTQYDFAAYSLGKGNTTTTTGATPTTSTTYATASPIDMAKVGSNGAVFTLTGSVDELKSCYISDLVTAYNQNSVSDYGNVVTFSFRSLATKIRIAFYETIPGYSVKDIKFYSIAKSAEGTTPSTPTDNPTLFTSSAVLPSGSGTMTVTYPTTGWANSGKASGSTKATDYNKAHVSFAQASGVAAASTVTFDAISNFATSAEGKIAAGTNGYIGRASNDASYAGGLVSNAGKYYTIMPNESGANLQLRIKYTLVSTDNSNETITVDNATAVVPAELAKWSPNYAYTYIFKISDMTNGTTGINAETGAPEMGLTPITLNAVVVDSEDGIQETITTVSEPSITTYAEGKVVTVNDEYAASIPIYVIVNDGGSNVTLSSTNAKLYTAVATDAIQEITEETVKNALRYGVISTTTSTNDTYTMTDADNGTLVVTDVTPTNWLVKEIDAADSPTGNKVEIDGTNTKAAKFTPSASTIYVFQYIKTAGVDGTYTLVTAGTTLTAGATYYTSERGAGKFEAAGTEVASATNKYWTLDSGSTPSDGEYMYKIIKVQ